MEALNLAGVPAASEWRKTKNIFYLANIREVLVALPPSMAFAPTSSEQPSTTQAPLPPAKVPKRPSKDGDQGQEVEVAKDKGKGKEVKLPLEAKGSETTLKVKDVALKAKEADPKPKGADPKPTNLPISQPGNRLTLLQPRHSLGFFSFAYGYVYIFCMSFSFVVAIFHVQDVLLLLLNEKTLTFALADLCFSCNICLWSAVVTVLPFVEISN